MKPEKIIYPNQDKIYIRLKSFIESNLCPEVFEAYITGSVIKRKFGKYTKKYKEHDGSDIDVVVMIPQKDIPSNWKDLNTEGTWWNLYSGGKIEVKGTLHRLDLLVVKEGKEDFTRNRLKELSWELEKIRG